MCIYIYIYIYTYVYIHISPSALPQAVTRTISGKGEVSGSRHRTSVSAGDNSPACEPSPCNPAAESAESALHPLIWCSGSQSKPILPRVFFSGEVACSQTPV